MVYTVFGFGLPAPKGNVSRRVALSHILPNCYSRSQDHKLGRSTIHIRQLQFVLWLLQILAHDRIAFGLGGFAVFLVNIADKGTE